MRLRALPLRLGRTAITCLQPIPFGKKVIVMIGPLRHDFAFSMLAVEYLLQLP